MIPSSILDWLLDPSEPSIRFRTMTELLGIPLHHPEALALRKTLPESRAVRTILDRMTPQGTWRQKNSHGQWLGDGVEYGAFATTHYALAMLAELGLDRRDPGVAMAAERYLNLQSPDGDFWMHLSCLFGYNVRTFLMLGYGGDPRIERTITLMRTSHRFDRGHLCDLHEGKRKGKVRSCARGSAKVLMAYAALPELWDTPDCTTTVAYFLNREGLFQSRNPQRFVTREASQTIFPFTYGAGVLDIVVPLSLMGYGADPRLDRAWQVLEDKRDAQGRYILDWTAPQSLLKAGPRGAPSKWVTFYALLAQERRHQVLRDAPGTR